MATLKNLVAETTNIKNELENCHTNLKNNLIEKDVEVLNSDKLATLVDKVGTIKTQQKTVVGDDITIYKQGSQSYSIVAPSTASYTDTIKYEALFVNGSIRIKNNWSNNGIKQVSFLLLDSKDSVLDEKSFTHSSASVDYVAEFNNLSGHNKVLVRVIPKTSALTATSSNFSITCNLA